MDREGFRNRLNQYKEARGLNPLLKYWDWKLKYYSASQPDEMPSSLQPDSQSIGSGLLENRAHRWDSLHAEINRQPFDSPYDDSRYYDYRKPRFEFRKGDVHYGNPGLLKWMGRFGKVLRGGSLLGEVVQNLFPSEEAERIEDLRVKMDKQNKWLTGQEDIPMYDEGGEVEEPGLWDKFTNTVNVLYNNAARKVKNFFEEEVAGEVIDLSNQRLTRVTPNTKNLTAIYGNEFVENNANNIRTRKQFEETADTLIGDRQIPLSQISNFYGIENGKLKAGDLSTFDENTVVIPNRAKKTGKIKEIIFTEPLSEHKIDSLRRVNRLEQSAYHVRLKEFADSLGMDYGSNKFTLLFYGSPYSNLLNRYREAIRNDSDQEFVKKYNELKKMSPRLIEALNQLRHGNISYVTESNDTIRMANTSMPALTKTMYADELGNSLFINNTKNLSKEQQDYVNEKLKVTPMYPILIDNGRYQHYQTDFPSYHTYTSFDFARDPKNMYVIGALRFAEGGEVEPDPLEVLERSRPRVAGIPINDKPLSGTDPIGEAIMWGLGGGAASAALRSMFPTYGATAGWLAFGDNGNENALVVTKPLRKGDPTVKPISTGNISEDTRDFYREYVMPLSDHLTEQEKLDFINNNANFMYNVYPESRFDEGVLGFRNKYTGEIALNEKILDDPIIFGRTMAHESDHALEQVKERPRWQTYRINRNSPRTKNQKKTRAGSNSEAYATHEANKWDIINNFELENGRKPTLAEFQLHTDVVPAKTLSSFRNRDSYGRMYEENEIKKLAQKHLTAYDYSKWLDTYKRNTLKYVPATIPFILTTNKEES